MIAFLKQISNELLKLSTEELKSSLLIVPNRRAKLYILKYISESIDKPIFTPEIISINDFIYSQVNMVESDPMDTLIQLYNVHRSIEGNNSQSLDQFSTWADLLISDFNDIDLYMVPVDRLFSYLSDAKEIEKWDLDPTKLTEQEKSYLRFYKKLNQYYTELNKILKANHTAYQGLAFRTMAEMDSYNLDYKHIYIIGFNAFTLAEEVIIKKLEKEYNAKTYWDIDKYYFDNKRNEAGHFLRKHLYNTEVDKIKFIGDSFINDHKEINIYGVDGNIAQVKFAAELLQKQLESNPETIKNTALILADENLLIPVISSIPSSIKNYNLTMSYPIRLHNGYELIKLILNLYKDYKFEKDNESGLHIYYKHFTNFILHPYIKQYLDHSKDKITKYIDNLNTDNVLRIGNDELQLFAQISDESNIIIELIKSITNEAKSSLEIVIAIFELLNNQEELEWEKSFLSHYIEILIKLNDSLSEIGNIEKLSTIKRWVHNLVNQSPIPFIGEPLQGLQIMGMLETRTLDFENIIILSVNENILPKVQAYQSFILFDIKKEFGMPLPSDNDSIAAYHFYRLLQRSKNINLIYSSAIGSMQSGEMSRFIKQLELEIPEVESNIKIKHQKVLFGFSASEKAKEIVIEKDDEIISKIKIFAKEKGFSPSSLNNYKKCSYYFYLQKILNIKSSDEVEENMAYNTQGNIIHNSLEDYYKPFINKELTFNEFNDSHKTIFNIFNEKLRTEYKNMNTETGKNFLTRKILEQYLHNFIDYEKNFLKTHNSVIIKGVEERLEKTLDINIDNEVIKVKLGGSADRVDLLGNTLRLIDYKTGAVHEADLKITKNKKDGMKDKWPLMFDGELDKAFQLMMYAWMYWDKKLNNLSMETSISALKLHSKNFPLSLYGETSITKNDINLFESDLKDLIYRIMDKDTPIIQRKNDRKCELCEYRDICSR